MFRDSRDYNSNYRSFYEKVKFAIIFRIFAFSVIIAAYVLLNFRNIPVYRINVYIFAGFAVLITLFYFAVLAIINKTPDRRYLVYFAYVQVFIDISVITVAVIAHKSYFGDFSFLYYLSILVSGFMLLRPGVMFSGILSALAVGFSGDAQYYLDLGGHSYFSLNPDKLLMLTSLNILGVLIFASLLYRLSGELNALGVRIVEREEYIKDAQRFNMELFNSFSQGIIVVDDRTDIIFINDAALKMLDSDASADYFNEKVGVPYNFHIKINDLFGNFPAGVFSEREGGRTANASYSEYTENGRKYTGGRDFDVLGDDGAVERFELKHKGRILGFGFSEIKSGGRSIAGRYIILFRDITYIKQLEIESKINEGLSAAGKIAGWLAHEIKNPISAINTSAYVLNSENPSVSGEDYRKLAGIIKTEAKRLDNLVNDFLVYLKVKSRNPGYEEDSLRFNLNSFTEETACRIAGAGKKIDNGGILIKVHNNVSPEIEIFAEKNRIGQVLANLMQNAIQSIYRKFSSSGPDTKKNGIVRIGSSILSMDGGKEYLCISVADNGDGMDEFTAKNAFKPLFTTRKDGFGLGLSIVNSVIESMDGKIEFISRPGRGTLFKVIIPLSFA